MTFAVMKNEMTIILHLYKRCLKLPVLVAILEIAVATIEIRGVERYDLLIIAIAKVEQIVLEHLHYLLQKLIAVRLLAKDLIQRHGIGRLAVERLLVDIDACPDDTVADMSVRQTVLYDGATDLLVFPIDVVRPFDSDTVGILRQHVTKGQRPSLRDEKLRMHRHPHRMTEDGEQQILASLALPGIRALPSPGSLILRGDDGKIDLISVCLSEMVGEISTSASVSARWWER